MTIEHDADTTCLGRAELGAVEQDLIRKSWTHYETVDVEARMVKIATTRPIARCIYLGRLDRARMLLADLERFDVSPFSTHLRLGPAGVSVCFSPVLETSGETLLVVDGMHRIVAAMEAGLSSIVGLVVRAAHLPPPTIAPCTWDEVERVGKKRTRAEKFPGYDPDLFRTTGKYLDNLSGPYDSAGAALEAVKQAQSSNVFLRRAL